MQLIFTYWFKVFWKWTMSNSEKLSTLSKNKLHFTTSLEDVGNFEMKKFKSPYNLFEKCVIQVFQKFANLPKRLPQMLTKLPFFWTLFLTPFVLTFFSNKKWLWKKVYGKRAEMLTKMVTSLDLSDEIIDI